MGLLEGCKSLALYLATLLPIPFSRDLYPDQRLFAHLEIPSLEATGDGEHGPKFPAPSGPDWGSPFICEYPALGPGWSPCSTSENRSCWLKGPNGREFSLGSDYENTWPVGITREYYLEAQDFPLNSDGVLNPGAKVFNRQYPGPWIQACWGDLIKVTVKNSLQFNGTTVHWHGFRQLGTPEMDGVNAITQCPIAPTENFTYVFRATQYGTSWYHSHYSLQYADGLHGPISIHGPSSSTYDEGRDPLIITDWNHRSAFKEYQRELVPNPDFPKMNSVLINGIGNFAGAFGLQKWTTVVEKGKKYLFRLINTSVDTTWIFTIDNHTFTVMTTDFVAVKPFNVTHVVIGIGQRYNIVLNTHLDGEATQSEEGNFWIRAVPADGCQGFETGNTPDERQGILRYEAASTAVPQTSRDNFSNACRDENYSKLEPFTAWQIPPINLSQMSSKFDIGKMSKLDRPALKDDFSWWAVGDNPLWLNFSNPTILNLDNKTWSDDYVVIPENFNDTTWVYLVVTAPDKSAPGFKNSRSFFPVAHPMHLHGHDFVLLAQGNDSDKLPDVQLKFGNPPRRDVVLLPSGGYIVIAFKTDNPGTWLFHCHIPWHASGGLAMQIMERQTDLRHLMTDEKLKETRRICNGWDTWFGNKSNWWDGNSTFQDDSGI